MQKTIFLSLLTLILLQSCQQDEAQIPTCEGCEFTCLAANDPDVVTNACLDNWDCQFKFTPLSRVDTTHSQGLGSGNKTVFQMINSTEGSAEIADDEFTHILVFELDESQQSFSVEGDELSDLNVHFQRICFCIDRGFQAVTVGCMQGEKQPDGTWFVQGNLSVPFSFGDIEVKFDAQFVN